VHAIVGSAERETVAREWAELSSVRIAGSVAELEAAGADLAACTAATL
jgi:hypothetical protein